MGHGAWGSYSRHGAEVTDKYFRTHCSHLSFLFMSVLCGAELTFKTMTQKLWFTLELEDLEMDGLELQNGLNDPNGLQNGLQTGPELLYSSKVIECQGYTAWPQWDEVVQLAELSQCRNKSVWFRLYDEDHLIGQLYLDATEIDVDNVVRWYELEPGFMLHERNSEGNR